MPAPAPVAASETESQGLSEQALHEQVALQQNGPAQPGQPGGHERHGEGGARRGRRRGRRGGRRRRFEERGPENAGQPNPVQGNLDPADDNRGNVAPPDHGHHDDHDDGDAGERSHSHDVHDHAHAVPAPQAREEYHEPTSAADHDDRTMPNPYRIPETVARHEPAVETHTGGGETPPTSEPHE